MAFTSNPGRMRDGRRLAAFSLAFVAVLTALVVLGAGRATSNADWLVLAASGEAEWRQGPGQGDWRGLEPNGRVPDGAEIRTGNDGTAVVAQGLDRIEIQPATSLVIAARSAGRERMQIDQTSGRATYTVEKRPAGTFSVHTPYLVAVVKGTKFDVEVAGEETSVSVTEGRVGVSDSRSGSSVDVNPGEKATARAEKPGLQLGRHSANAATPEEAPAKASEQKSASGGSSGGSSAGGSSGGSSDASAGSGSSGAADGVGEAAGVGGASEAVGGAMGDVGGAVGDVGEAAGDAVGDVGEAVGGTVGDTVGGLGDAVGGLGDRLGGGLGGLGGGLGGGGFGGKN